MHGTAAITSAAPNHPQSLTFKNCATLPITTFLCLPSLIGGAALVLQLAVHNDIREWNDTASALIALGALVGTPLIAVAAVMGAITSLAQVPAGVKWANLIVVVLAALATLSLWISFGP